MRRPAVGDGLPPAPREFCPVMVHHPGAPSLASGQHSRPQECRQQREGGQVRDVCPSVASTRIPRWWRPSVRRPVPVQLGRPLHRGGWGTPRPADHPNSTDTQLGEDRGTSPPDSGVRCRPSIHDLHIRGSHTLSGGSSTKSSLLTVRGGVNPHRGDDFEGPNWARTCRGRTDDGGRDRHSFSPQISRSKTVSGQEPDLADRPQPGEP